MCFPKWKTSEMNLIWYSGKGKTNVWADWYNAQFDGVLKFAWQNKFLRFHVTMTTRRSVVIRYSASIWNTRRVDFRPVREKRLNQIWAYTKGRIILQLLSAHLPEALRIIIQFSNGWLQKFKNFNNSHGESCDADKAAIHHELASRSSQWKIRGALIGSVYSTRWRRQKLLVQFVLKVGKSKRNISRL